MELLFRLNNKKPKEEIVKNSLDLKFRVEKANEILLNLLPNWINEVEIKSNYRKEDYKYLLTKFYKGGILNENDLYMKYFGNLTKQIEIDFLEYVNKLK